MKFNVTAHAVNRIIGTKIAPERTELIDTNKNELFKGHTTAYSVKKTYEAFWNEMTVTNEVVFVTDVEII